MPGGSSPLYFANMSFGGGERLWALLIPAKGEPFLVCPAFEEDRVREVLTDSPFSPNIGIRTFQEDESPFERVAAGLKDRGIASGRLGIEETVKFVFADSIAQAAPALKISWVREIVVTQGMGLSHPRRRPIQLNADPSPGTDRSGTVDTRMHTPTGPA